MSVLSSQTKVFPATSVGIATTLAWMPEPPAGTSEAIWRAYRSLAFDGWESARAAELATSGEPLSAREMSPATAAKLVVGSDAKASCAAAMSAAVPWGSNALGEAPSFLQPASTRASPAAANDRLA